MTLNLGVSGCEEPSSCCVGACCDGEKIIINFEFLFFNFFKCCIDSTNVLLIINQNDDDSLIKLKNVFARNPTQKTSAPSSNPESPTDDPSQSIQHKQLQPITSI